jgi:hypothetical protein
LNSGGIGVAPAWGGCGGTFTLAGTSGSNQTISAGDTLTIAAGSNITTTGSATDILTVATVANPSFATSVSTPIVTTASGGLTLQSSSNAVALTGTVTAKPVTDTNAAFKVQNAGATISLLTVDTESATDPLKVQIGDTSTALSPVLLVLDTEDADPTGTSGAMYYNSTLETFRCYMNGGWSDCMQNVRTTYHQIHDYDNSDTTEFASPTDDYALTGATYAFNSPAGETGHPFIIRMGTGANAAGLAGSVSRAGGILLGGGDTWEYTAEVRLNATSIAAQSYVFRAGFVGSTSGDPANGCLFRYDIVNLGGNGHWQAICRNAGTESTICDTGLTPNFGTTTWDNLRILVNAAGTSVGFYVNDTLACTVTTQIPTANTTGWGMYIGKTLGSAVRSLDADYQEVLGRFGSRR